MSPAVAARPAFLARFDAFVTDQSPFALEGARPALDAAVSQLPRQTFTSPRQLDKLRQLLATELRRRLQTNSEEQSVEVTPGVVVAERRRQAVEELVELCDGFLYRESLLASLSDDERREILGGMLLTRAVDNRLKKLHADGEARWNDEPFLGTGWRSRGREAVYAVGLRMRRSNDWRSKDGSWSGDLAAPSRRGLGLALAMNPEPDLVRRALAAQVGKGASEPAGRAPFFSDMSRGILPVAHLNATSCLTAVGLALAMKRSREDRVTVALVGDGGSAVGEWHEAINQAALGKLPMVFVVESDPALAPTEAAESAARRLADKAVGYGLPALSIDGTDPDAVAVAAIWAIERAREGKGPAVLELVAMRMCGPTHATDSSYLGREPMPGWDDGEIGGGRVDADRYAYWAEHDPIRRYSARLMEEQLVSAEELEVWKQEADEVVATEADAVLAAAWPDADSASTGVLSDQPAASRQDPLFGRLARVEVEPGLPEVEPGAPFDPSGTSLVEAIQHGLEHLLETDRRVFLFGAAGAARDHCSGVLEPLRQLHGKRVLSSPGSTAGILGVCVGAALAGERPIGEVSAEQLASGFNQLVSNAAQLRFRHGQSVPMVLRIPAGGHCSPDPSTGSWFYRTPGLKVAVPSTPEDARSLLLAAVADPDPVLFYEPVELYDSVEVCQPLGAVASERLELGRAALRRAGSDLLLVAWGASVHRALLAAESLAETGIDIAVLDLRTLVPLDRASLLRCVRHCGRVLIAHRDSRTGGVGESLAAIIQEEAFEFLDAPVRILGALDTPVPYSPPLAQAFFPSRDEIERAARLLLAY